MKQVKTFLVMPCILAFFFALAGGTVTFSFNRVSIYQELETSTKGKIIEEIAQLVADKYVFPNVAQKISDEIQIRQQNKEYESISSLPQFLQQLTKDLRSVNNDGHLGVIPRRGPAKQGVSPEEMYQTMFIKRAPFQNYGFKKAERLLGNVGCLVLDELSYVEMNGENVGGKTAKAAMQMLSNSSALIIDLRDNFGGREEMALLLLDYFFEKSVHVLNNRYRGRQEREIWTGGENAGGRLTKIPLYVLTSRHTVSGGEMLAYVLKNRKRATIIGEKTRGAAHRTHLFSLENAKVDVAIPVGTTIDPVTGTDWEGKGVEPDIAVPAGQALDVAYKKALEALIESGKYKSHRYEMEWALMEAEARLNPVKLDESSLQEFAGVFGERKIFVENGILHYQKEDNTPYELVPMAADVFTFVDKGMFYVRVKFHRDESGRITKMILLYDTGQKDEFPKK
jgi:hypothetical protein